MKNSDNTFAIIGVIFAILAIGGWCANIYKLIDTGFSLAQWGGMEVARVIGVFVAPLGSVLGFF